MSNGIRKYEPDTEWFENAERLDVRAVVGGIRFDPREEKGERQGHGKSVQLTINGEFTILTEKQILDLIGVLSKRVEAADGFSGTDATNEKTVLPDGTKEVKETSW